MPNLLYFIFFLSGATGLVYEIIWVRLTGLVFGNTAYSISTVLGAFMAGLAFGSWKLGQKADRIERPLRMYGILEVLIGVSAAAVPFAFKSLDSIYWATAPALASLPGADLFVRFVTSFVVLLIPTFLMGGTLPVLTRYFVSNESEVERKVALLYALNTFGAAAGVLVAALVLIPELGTLRATFLVAALNTFIGLLAIRLDLQSGAEGKLSFERVEGDGAKPMNPGSDRLVLITLGLSGFVAMLYEVAWTRALAAMIGSSTYAFSIMLVTFLVGIALGSWIIGRLRPAASLRLLGVVQLGVAAGGLIFLAGYLATPYFLIGLIRALFYSFPAILTTQFLACAGLMIFATLFMGATFPIGGQLYSNRMSILGRRIGGVYSVNTLGAIAGSLSAGFLLLPVIGTERTILTGLFANAAIALVLLAEEKFRPYTFAKWTALVLLLVATVSMRGGFFWDPELLDRGILIYARQFEVRPELKISEHYQDTDLVYFAEGRNATISVRRGENYVGLRTNGKVDASNRDDMMTQLLLAYLPGFQHLSPRTALIIGYGAGVTAGAATAIPEIQQVDCVEIEPAVVGAAPFFAEINRKSYENPKIRIIYDDARNYLNITRNRYDVIISEPSNPWIAGVGNLFTAEFYQRAEQVLNPGGVFAQWIHLYEMSPEDLRMVFAEFQREFPEVTVWNTGASDLILMGTREPQSLDLARVKRIAASDPAIRRDLWNYLHLTDPLGITAYYVMSTEEVRQFAQTGLRNTDDHPLLEFHAPRTLFAQTRDLNIDLLYEHKAGLVPPGASISDPEKTYMAMVPPLLAMKRSILANQAMAILAQSERRHESSLYLTIARINVDSGNLESAQNSLVKTEDLPVDHENVAEREELWGMVKEKMGSTSEAVQRFRRAVAADPTRSFSIQRLAELNAQLALWEEAEGWMERYIATQPPSIAHSWAMLGDYRLAGKKTTEALEALETALRLDPYSYWGHYRLASLFEQQKDTERAIEQFEFLTKYAFDRNPEIYIKLGQLYQSAGRLDDASEVLETGTRIFPTNPGIYRLYRSIKRGD